MRQYLLTLYNMFFIALASESLCDNETQIFPETIKADSQWSDTHPAANLNDNILSTYWYSEQGRNYGYVTCNFSEIVHVGHIAFRTAAFRVMHWELWVNDEVVGSNSYQYEAYTTEDIYLNATSKVFTFYFENTHTIIGLSTINFYDCGLSALTSSPSSLPTEYSSSDPTRAPTNPTTDPTFAPTLPYIQSPTVNPSNIPNKINLKVLSTEFSEDNGIIYLTFKNAMTSRGEEQFDCAQLLKQSTVVLLGNTYAIESIRTTARCEWPRNDTLAITLGDNASITQNDEIVFLKLTNCNGTTICYVDTDGNSPDTRVFIDNINVPSGNDVDIKAVIIAPWAIGYCQDLAFKSASYGGAGRVLKHTWTLPLSLNDSSCPNQTVSTSVESIEISASCIIATMPVPGDIVVTLNVRNWLQQTAVATFTVYYTATQIPSVSFRGSSAYDTNRGDSFTVVADVSLTDCDITNNSFSAWFSYNWVQDDGGIDTAVFGWDSNLVMNEHVFNFTGSQKSNKNLVFEPYTLEYGAYYVFKFEVYLDSISNGYNYVGIFVNDRPMPVFTGYDPIFSIGIKNSLSVLDLFTFSEPRGSAAPNWYQDGDDLDSLYTEMDAIQQLYNFKWACSKPNGEECEVILDEQGISLSYDENSTNEIFSQLDEFTAEMMVTRKSDNYSQSLNVTIEVSTNYYPKVLLELDDVVVVSSGSQAMMNVYVVPHTEYIDPAYGIKNLSISATEIVDSYSLSWTAQEVTTGVKLTSPAFSWFMTSAVLDASDNSIVGKVYEIILEVTPGPDMDENAVTVTGLITVNYPPSSGFCDFTPPRGEAFVDLFQITCVGWSDLDTPLLYSFYAKQADNGNITMSLQTSAQLADFTFNLGIGTYILTAVIEDSYGSSTVESATVEAYQSVESQAGFENDTASYLNKSVEQFTSLGSSLNGDISTLASLVCQVPSLTTYALSVNSSDEITQLAQNTISKLVISVNDTLTKITPTEIQLSATTSILSTLTSYPDQLNINSVELGSGTARGLMETMITVKSMDTVRKFSSDTVASMETVSQQLLFIAAEQGQSEDILRDLMRTSSGALRNALVDTLPGQSGYENGDSTKAARVAQGDIDISTAYVQLPAELGGLTGAQTADVVMTNSDFNVVDAFTARRRTDNNQSNSTIQGNVVSVNVFDAEDQIENGASVDLDADPITISAEVVCEPILLIIATGGFNITNLTTENSTEIPLCVSVEDAAYSSGWSELGCSLIAWTSTEATCSCTHLSEFSVLDEEYIPEIGTMLSSMFKNVTWDTLMENPITFIVTVIFFTILFRLIPEIGFHISDCHLLIHDKIWSERRWLLVKRSFYFRQTQALVQPLFWIKWTKITLVNLCNNHAFLGIWLRDTCTNYTSHQRLMALFTGLASALCCQAVYYGLTGYLPVVESLIQLGVTVIVTIIPTICGLLYKKHHPGSSIEAYTKIRRRNERIKLMKETCRCFLWDRLTGTWCRCCLKDRDRQKIKKGVDKLSRSIDPFSLSPEEEKLHPLTEKTEEDYASNIGANRTTIFSNLKSDIWTSYTNRRNSLDLFGFEDYDREKNMSHRNLSKHGDLKLETLNPIIMSSSQENKSEKGLISGITPEDTNTPNNCKDTSFRKKLRVLRKERKKRTNKGQWRGLYDYFSGEQHENNQDIKYLSSESAEGVKDRNRTAAHLFLSKANKEVEERNIDHSLKRGNINKARSVNLMGGDIWLQKSPKGEWVHFGDSTQLGDDNKESSFDREDSDTFRESVFLIYDSKKDEDLDNSNSKKNVAHYSKELPDEFQISDRTSLIFERVTNIVQRSHIHQINDNAAKLLDLVQVRLCREMTWNIKLSWFAWFLFWSWLIACSSMLIVFGVNMDLNDTYDAETSILESATSQCSATTIGTVELYVDVSATDAMNLEQSLAQAIEENKAWEAYPEDPAAVFGDDVSEATKFLLGTFASWCIGTFITSLITSPAGGFIKAIQMHGKRKYFLSLIATQLERANEISSIDIPNNELLFMLIFNPRSILKVHSIPIEKQAASTTEDIGYLACCVECMLTTFCCYQDGPSYRKKKAITNIPPDTVLGNDMNETRNIELVSLDYGVSTRVEI